MEDDDIILNRILEILRAAHGEETTFWLVVDTHGRPIGGEAEDLEDLDVLSVHSRRSEAETALAPGLAILEQRGRLPIQ